MGIETALIASSVIGTGAAIHASNRAADAQVRSTNAAIGAQNNSLERMLEIGAPTREFGENAMNELSQLFGFDGSAPDQSVFQTSPDYQFRKEQGMEGIAQTLGASGQGAFSGNALRSLNQHNSDLASGEFGNFVNRRLAMAGLGQNANFQAGQGVMNNGANVGNALMQQGNARASGILGSGAAINNGMNGVIQAMVLKDAGLIS